ncbi:MAG: hypothetical protein R6X13_07540 [bacterium]
MRTLLCLLAVAACGTAAAQAPENAFIIIIDGMRHDESWALGATNLPRIWNDLKPLGTYHSRFWDRGWTATTGGHLTILSGVRQILRNNGSNEQEIRSFDPLLFEYYRQYFNLGDTTACGVVIGKTGNVGDITDFSLEPAYGAQWQGFVRGDAATHDDTASTRLLHRTMDSLHPRLVLLNLADVDTKGHTGIYSDYLASIRVADSLIYDIWQHIQAEGTYTDTFYRNRTVMIVTSDHGRNDDAHGSFPGHGEWDHGSRQLGLLAIGPGIARNRVTAAAPRDQIDIAPTLAAMLGFPVPFAEGDVMTELFAAGYAPKPPAPRREPVVDAANLSNTAGFSRDPDICRGRDGSLYLVWSDNSPGRWSVQLRKSTDNGANWSATQSLFAFPAAESVMWYARVAADDSVAVSAMGYGRHLCRVDSVNPAVRDTTYLWYPWLATSTNGGAGWSYASLLDSSMGSYHAPVTVRNGRVGVAWWAVGQFTWQSPRNGVFFNNRGPGGAWRGVPVEPTSRQSLHLSMQDDGSAYHVAAAAWDDTDFDLAYCRSTDAGATWATTWVARDSAGFAQYDYDPELVVDDSGAVHVFWARKPNTGGQWAVMYGRRDPSSGTWDTTRLVISPGGAAQPHAAIKGDTMALAWIDYRDGNPEVYTRHSPDRGSTWSAPERLTFTAALTHHPRLAPAASGFYCVWQDGSSGNWEIYGRQLDLGRGREAAIVRIDAPTGSFDSLAAVAPRATYANLGGAVASLEVFCTIRDGLGATAYSDSGFVVDLAPGASYTHEFSLWPRPHLPGGYTLRCSLYIAGDADPANNSLGGAFTVTVPVPGWLELAPVPITPSGRPSKDGAWLVADEGQEMLFAAKGYKTADFYGYAPRSAAWFDLPQIPPGLSGRSPYKGAAACGDGNGVLYATRGNNTLEFYRYSHPAGWTTLAEVPIGIYNKKVKGGTDMVYVPGFTDHVYVLKGYRNEFLRYHVTGDSWQALPYAPVGLSIRWDKGSWLCFDGDHTIYAHKAKYHEFYKFDVNTLTWSDSALKPMPLYSYTGRTRKAKDGSSAAWLAGAIYAFKGANTQEFWRYRPAGDSWAEQETLPSIGWSGRRKRVKGGGDIASYGPLLYALKGNKSSEFWRYVPGALDATRETQHARTGLQGVKRDASGVTLVVQTPSRGAATIRWSGLPTANSSQLTLHDASGRVVLTRSLGGLASGKVELDLGLLPAGVYVARIGAGGPGAVGKVVVRR